jgi:1-acyl-sn-glycerol-3-phosphate acyltransferase
MRPEHAIQTMMRECAAVPMRAYLRAYHRLQIEGRENLPGEGSFILISNHASHLDALCLQAALPMERIHQVFSAAASDYFSVGLPRVALAAGVVNAVPFARQVHVRQSLSLCQQILATPGNILILFPEGTRTVTGEVGPFKPGIASLVTGTGLPVVPCAIQGAFAAWPKGGLLPRPGSLRLVIGKPRRYSQHASGHQSNHQIADELRDAVRALL